MYYLLNQAQCNGGYLLKNSYFLLLFAIFSRLNFMTVSSLMFII